MIIFNFLFFSHDKLVASPLKFLIPLIFIFYLPFHALVLILSSKPFALMKKFMNQAPIFLDLVLRFTFILF